jgi:hypothetical protein
MLNKPPAVLALAISLALIVVLPAQSQRKPQRQNADPAQQRPDTNKQGTEDSPFIVKILPTPQTQTETKGASDKGENKWLDGWSLSDKIAAIASFVGLLQFLALFATVWIMMRTARRQLRAYVWGSTVRNVNIDANPFEAQMTIKNSGVTPAYDVRCWTRLKAYSAPLAAGFTFEAAPRRIGGPKYVVNPDSDHSVLTQAEPALTPDEIIAVKDGKRGLYIWGEIQYRDAYKKWRRTRFRLLWVHAPPHARGMWRYCDEGNNAT